MLSYFLRYWLHLAQSMNNTRTRSGSFPLISLQGVPASLTSVQDLIEMLTVFIFISSVGHAAANFGQYDEYAFPPNYPSTLNCERPTTKVTLRKQSTLYRHLLWIIILLMVLVTFQPFILICYVNYNNDINLSYSNLIGWDETAFNLRVVISINRSWQPPCCC